MAGFSWTSLTLAPYPLHFDKFPFIFEDTREPDNLLDKTMEGFLMEHLELEFNPDLVAEATSFIARMCNTGLGSQMVNARVLT
jgi:hypothetical protein